jgi:hypothetical protein
MCTYVNPHVYRPVNRGEESINFLFFDGYYYRFIEDPIQTWRFDLYPIDIVAVACSIGAITGLCSLCSARFSRLAGDPEEHAGSCRVISTTPEQAMHARCGESTRRLSESFPPDEGTGQGDAIDLVLNQLDWFGIQPTTVLFDQLLNVLARVSKVNLHESV